jgi:hypothetical protein
MNSTSRPHTTENSMPLASTSWTPAGTAETRLTEDVDRFASVRLSSSVADEVVFVDERAEMTPSQAVEHRLVALLRTASLPVSHLQQRGLIRGRCDD